MDSTVEITLILKYNKMQYFIIIDSRKYVSDLVLLCKNVVKDKINFITKSEVIIPEIFQISKLLKTNDVIQAHKSKKVKMLFLIFIHSFYSCQRVWLWLRCG